MTRRDPAAGLGPVQRLLLLLLADGTPRSVARIDTDTLLSPGRARSALEGLSRRSLVERDHTSGDRSGDHGIQWFLTDRGQAVAVDLHGLDEEQVPRCPHGRPEDEPCRACREGLWRCDQCGQLVRGGQRAPHRREVHGVWKYRRTGWTWAPPSGTP